MFKAQNGRSHVEDLKARSISFNFDNCSNNHISQVSF